jgi:hypothetical protein
VTVEAVYRAAGRSGAPLGMQKIHSSRDYQELTADATASAPGVISALTGKADKIADSARVVLASSTDDPKSASLKNETLAEIGVKSAKEFFRGLNAKNGRNVEVKSKNTRIPVVLVVSDGWASQWFEFGRGSGTAFPASRFMRVAGMAGNSRLGKFNARGRSR